VHFCFLTPLERAFFFHFSQLPLWKKWLISPLENEVLDRGGTGIKCNSPLRITLQITETTIRDTQCSGSIPKKISEIISDIDGCSQRPRGHHCLWER
jgi:hypothetical protein